MAKANSEKNKDKKNKKNKSEKKLTSLKSLKSDQKRITEPKAKSLNSLKKIQTQLDGLVNQRDKEKKLVKNLKKHTETITRQFEVIEARFPELASNKDLKKIKNELGNKSTQFQKSTEKLTREISIFSDLTGRVENKIKALEKQLLPNNQLVQSLDKNQEILFKKINHFDQELKKLIKEITLPDQVVTDFTEQLNQLTPIVSELNQNHQDQDTRIKLLQTDTANIRKSLQQVQGIDNKMAGLIPKLDKADEQSSDLAQGLEQLNKKTDSINQSLLSKITEQSQTTLTSAIASVSAMLSSQEDSQKQLQEQARKNEQLVNQHYEALNDRLSAAADEQEKFIVPFAADLKQLEESIQSIKQDFSKHQPLEVNENKLSELGTRVNEFNEILQQSQDELKQHIQLFHKNKDDEHSEQFKQINHKLEQLSQHVKEVSEQSGALQGLLSEKQEHYLVLESTFNEQNNTVSNQFREQQQQLEHIDTRLNPLIEKNSDHEQKISQFSSTLQQLASGQSSLAEIEQTIQSNLTILAQKLDQSHSTQKESINELESHQQKIKTEQLDIESRQQEMDELQHRLDSRQQATNKYQQDLEDHQRKINSHQQVQEATLEQLGDKIKRHSKLYTIGLIAVLGISTLLFFNQEILEDDTESQAAISKLKSEISNETFSKINDLTRKNSKIINQQLNQIRNLIKHITANNSSRKMIDLQPLQEQYAFLQDEVLKIQTDQQSVNQSVNQSIVELSDAIKTLTEQLQELQKSVIQKAEILSTQQELLSDSKQPKNKQKKATPDVTDISMIRKPFYAIQLLGALQKDSIGHFIQNNNLSGDTRLYQTDLNGKPWYILIQGNYSSFSHAREHLQKLPDFLLKHHPWVRKLP